MGRSTELLGPVEPSTVVQQRGSGLAPSAASSCSPVLTVKLQAGVQLTIFSEHPLTMALTTHSLTMAAVLCAFLSMFVSCLHI